MFHIFAIYLFVAVCVSQSVESFLCGITKKEGKRGKEITKKSLKEEMEKMTEGDSEFT